MPVLTEEAYIDSMWSTIEYVAVHLLALTGLRCPGSAKRLSATIIGDGVRPE